MNGRSSQLFGILNVTRDSFSDGGHYLTSDAAIAKGLQLHSDGAAVVDVGAAASNPMAETVSPEDEIARLSPVVAALHAQGISVSVDTFSTPVQRWALGEGVAYLNDIQGFSDPSLYGELAGSSVSLVVMHSIQGRGKATVEQTDAVSIMARVFKFFDARIASLERAGIGRGRLILDPGMGFFLGDDPECSLAVLRRIPDLKSRYGLPILISVSRKSFLRRIAGVDVGASGPATLSAELFAAQHGVDFIRTHDVRSLQVALAINAVLRNDQVNSRQ